MIADDVDNKAARTYRIALGTKRHGWYSEAACTPEDLPKLFPKRGQNVRYEALPCAHCPVEAQCFAHSQEPPFERFGVWGGIPEAKREALRISSRNISD